MKRSRLERGDYQLPRTPLNRGESQLKRTRLNPISKKRKAANAANPDFREEVLEMDDYTCQLCKAAENGLWISDHPNEGMEYHIRTRHVHHIKGRIGPLLHDKKHAMTMCGFHHMYSVFAPHVNKPKFLALLEEIKWRRN
jgi:hypothetical protein